MATHGETGGETTGVDTVSITPTDGSAPLRESRVGETGSWNAGDWRPDGTAFVVGRPDGAVVTVPQEGRVRTLRAAPGGVMDLAHTEDGRHLVVADEAGSVRRIDAGTGRRAGRVVQLDGVATAVAVAGDGRRVLVLVRGTSDGPFEVGQVDTWAVLDVVDGRTLSTGPLPTPGDKDWWGADLDPSDPGRAAVFGPEGVMILDLESGRAVRPQVAAHDGYTEYGEYTQDGSLFLAGGDDGRVSIWDGDDGRLLDIATVDPGTQVAPVLLPDGVTLLAATSDGFYRWDTRIGPALEAACRAAGRSMTAIEWRTHVGEDVPYRATCG